MISIHNSKILSMLYCYISQLRHPSFTKEVERRAKLDLFDYQQIAQDLPKYFSEPCTDNNCFGIGYSLRQYAGVNRKFCNALVEHGYFFGTYVSEQEKTTFAKRILTFGDIRIKHINKKVRDKEIITIGPYIHYAKDYYNESRFAEEKKRLGKTLLVFFNHSGTGESLSFDIDELITKINSVRDLFNTVVISLFWSDINPLIEKRLKDEGYLIFSSGHRYDYYFLARQKTMIKLADVTMSNSVGTHIAYCSYYKKPHWIIKQEFKSVALSEKGAINIALDEMMSRDSANQCEKEELYQAFSEFSEELSNKQELICDKYFGFKYIRTKEEIRDFIQ